MALGAGVSLPLANFAEAAVADGVIGSNISSSQMLPVEKCSSSSAVGITVGTTTAGKAPGSIGAVMPSGPAWAGAAGQVGMAGAAADSGAGSAGIGRRGWSWTGGGRSRRWAWSAGRWPWRRRRSARRPRWGEEVGPADGHGAVAAVDPAVAGAAMAAGAVAALNE